MSPKSKGKEDVRHISKETILKLISYVGIAGIILLFISNYRPVSLLPYFSKILERLVFNRGVEYIDIHEILNDKQIWFSSKSPNVYGYHTTNW